MTFRGITFGALALTGLVPVLLLGWTSLEVNRDELVAVVREGQARAAEDLAAASERVVLEGVRGLRLGAGTLPFGRLSDEDLAAALEIPYRQLPGVNVLVLLGEAGRPALPPLVSAPGDGGEARDAVGAAELERFAANVPLEAALAAGAAVGPPYRAPSGGPRVALALRVEGSPRRVLAAELSLGEVQRRLDAAAAGGGRAFLVDGRGELVADAAGRTSLSGAERAFAAAAARGGAAVARAIEDGEDRWLAAWAPVGRLGWAVVTARPAASALRAADRVRRYTIFWAGVALVLTGALGAVLSRSVAGPVSRLAQAAREVTAGRYDVRVGGGSGDELGRLGAAFDHMTAEVRRRDEAIRGWSAELERRVEAKTAALRDAQEQIARSRRLAALGSLAAGVAHALNNPMTSVVGLVTLARRAVGAGDPRGDLLDEALAEARRATRVVNDLRRHAEQEREGEGRLFSPERPVAAALDAFRARLAERGIALRAELPAGLPAVHGDPAQIEELVSRLLENALHAMPGGGALEVTVAGVDGAAVQVTVADTGRGIPAELRDRIFDPFFSTQAGAGAGLGLSLAHGIVARHHGSIRVESEPGRGSRFHVVLPAAPAPAHLA